MWKAVTDAQVKNVEMMCEDSRGIPGVCTKPLMKQSMVQTMRGHLKNDTIHLWDKLFVAEPGFQNQRKLATKIEEFFMQLNALSYIIDPAKNVFHLKFIYL